MLDTTTVELEVRRFLADNFPLGDDPTSLRGDQTLLQAGLIDSTGVLELVGFLESRFDIAIADHELVPENLDSIDNIVHFLNGKIPT